MVKEKKINRACNATFEWVEWWSGEASSRGVTTLLNPPRKAFPKINELSWVHNSIVSFSTVFPFLSINPIFPRTNKAYLSLYIYLGPLSPRSYLLHQFATLRLTLNFISQCSSDHCHVTVGLPIPAFIISLTAKIQLY